MAVRSYPSIPHVENATSEILDGGHVWLQELLDGGQFRFQLQNSGSIRFGDSEREFDHGSIPPAYQHAVRYVRDELDRQTLRAAVDDVESLVFFAEALHRSSIAYEWHRTPHVLGFDIWDADRGQFLPPDSVEHVFERLGLRAVNTFEKEVRAADFQPSVDAIPQSAWYDGPAAGLFIRTKTGDRAMVPNPAIERHAGPEPLECDAEELAAQYATDTRLRRIATELEEQSIAVTFDSLYERVLEAIFRVAHGRLLHSQTTVEMGAFRSAIAARTRAWQSK